MNWSELKVVNYFFHIHTHHHTQEPIKAYGQGIPDILLHVMSSQQKNLYCNFTYKICMYKNCSAVLWQNISMPTIHATQPMFSAVTEIPRLRAIHLGTLHPSERNRGKILH